MQNWWFYIIWHSEIDFQGKAVSKHASFTPHPNNQRNLITAQLTSYSRTLKFLGFLVFVRCVTGRSCATSTWSKTQHIANMPNLSGVNHSNQLLRWVQMKGVLTWSLGFVLSILLLEASTAKFCQTSRFQKSEKSSVSKEDANYPTGLFFQQKWVALKMKKRGKHAYQHIHQNVGTKKSNNHHLETLLV